MPATGAHARRHGVTGCSGCPRDGAAAANVRTSGAPPRLASTACPASAGPAGSACAGVSSAARSQPRRSGPAQLGQPVAQPLRLLGHEARDLGVGGRGGGVQLHAGQPERRSTGPEVTSTSCMRPYGTTVSSRHSTPRLISRSSARSAYRQERQLRPSAPQPQASPPSGSSAKAAQTGPAVRPSSRPRRRPSAAASQHTTTQQQRADIRSSPAAGSVRTPASPVVGLPVSCAQRAVPSRPRGGGPGGAADTVSMPPGSVRDYGHEPADDDVRHAQRRRPRSASAAPRRAPTWCSTSAPSTPPRTACCACGSSSTASGSSTPSRSSAICTAARRSSSRPATTARSSCSPTATTGCPPSPTSWASSWPSSGCSAWRSPSARCGRARCSPS